MATQLTLKIGDLITIGKSNKLMLVTKSEHKTSYDTMRGDSYHVDQIETVDMGMTAGELKLHYPQGFNFTRTEFPNPRQWYFDTGSMHGAGMQVSPADIKVHGTLGKVKATVHTSYELGKLKVFA